MIFYSTTSWNWVGGLSPYQLNLSTEDVVKMKYKVEFRPHAAMLSGAGLSKRQDATSMMTTGRITL